MGVDASILSDSDVQKDLYIIKAKGWNLDVNKSLSFNTTTPKYSGCTNLSAIKNKNNNYKTNDIVNGKWKEHVYDLKDSVGMF